MLQGPGQPRLGSFDATAVALLFPRLQDPHSKSSLDLVFREDPEDPFLSIAAGQVKPTTLSLNSWSASLQSLPSMQQLQCLILVAPSHEQLHNLSMVLCHLPLLHTLSLKSYNYSYEEAFGEHSLAKVRIASPSLRTVVLGRVHPSWPELHTAHLPALQRVHLDGISLDNNLGSSDHATIFLGARFLASWLSTTPLSVAENADGFAFEIDPTWSCEFLESILSTALAPLQPFLATVTKLCTIGLGVGEQAVLSSLTNVFNNLIWWNAQDSSYLEDEIEIWPLLQKLPKLQVLAISIQFAPPKDLLAALKWVADEGRSFRLEVLVCEHDEEGHNDWYDRLSFLADQVCNARFKLLGPSVELVVLRGYD
ncbi:hypothetical protein DUNSADRAFT_13701 [Dunaliella salina]|uniref:Uncharacterized protein n=1 Tax=Dunaliella salina TaxID=3046 RepID=A0ABQ7H368_DUNSA|nr:hypothetical protein DUNSADRAFT_13701 [Dunaliella salina]|eukprot:KAF5841246.1 hypothetical protein DUNSADRAFT_13701 [Dunaliella salina]